MEKVILSWTTVFSFVSVQSSSRQLYNLKDLRLRQWTRKKFKNIHAPFRYIQILLSGIHSTTQGEAISIFCVNQQKCN